MAQELAVRIIAIIGLATKPVGAWLRRVILAVLVVGASGFSGEASAGVIRVCADPDNMPFSNDKGEGFENKLAELIAAKLDDAVDYTWFSESSGYVPNAVGTDACDLIMGYAQGTGLIDIEPLLPHVLCPHLPAERSQSCRCRPSLRSEAEGKKDRPLRSHAASEHARFVWLGGIRQAGRGQCRRERV